MTSKFEVLGEQIDQDIWARVPAAVVAMLLGVFVIYGVGFAQPAEIHNAAHDGRHAFAFPCH